MKKYKIIMVSTTTIRYVNIFDGKHSYSVDIDFDVPYDEICLNAYKQFGGKL